MSDFALDFIAPLVVPNDTRIVLVSLDGLAGLPHSSLSRGASTEKYSRSPLTVTSPCPPGHRTVATTSGSAGSEMSWTTKPS